MSVIKRYVVELRAPKQGERYLLDDVDIFTLMASHDHSPECHRIVIVEEVQP